MATGDYTDLTTLKAALGKTLGDEDARLASLITGASRVIDRVCRRRFFVASETRFFAADGPTVLNVFSQRRAGGMALDIDDLVSLTSLQTDDDGDGVWETTWAATDYSLLPVNAAIWQQPYTELRTNPIGGRYVFPRWPRGVRVTGSFGYWPSTPEPVAEAALRLCERLYKLADAPLGVLMGLGAAEGGMSVALMRVQQDRDIADLLAPFVRSWAFV